MSADVDETAARWHLAQALDDMDWLAFTQWLEADPRHREAFNAIALLDERIDAARPALSRLVVEEAPPTRRPFRRVVGWSGIAAGVLALVAVGLDRLHSGRPSEAVTYQAPAGQPLGVRFADGSNAVLAPGSSLQVVEAGGVDARLKGRAHFDVRHDPGRVFVVRTGGFEIRDLGTKFDVASGGAMVRVAVAEGRVGVRESGVRGEVTVQAGKALIVGGGDAPILESTSAASVTAWRSGPLAYEAVPLAIVVADVSRATGKEVTIETAQAKRRFSGVIAQGSREAMLTALSQMTGLKARVEGDAVRLYSDPRH